MIPLATLMDFFSRLTSGDYVDITCAGLVLVCAGIGLARGISGELSRLVSLALGATAGYWIFVPGVQTLADLEYFRKSPQFSGLIAFCVALLGGLICFLLLNYILSRIIKIAISTPLDRLLGLIAGLLNATILLALAFTLALILPEPSQRELLCRQSRVGRFATPRLTRSLHIPSPAPASVQKDEEEDEESRNTTTPAGQKAQAAQAAARPTPRPAAQAQATPRPASATKPVAQATPKPAVKAAPKTAPTLKRPRPSAKPLTAVAARPPATNRLAQANAPTAARE
jgi:uncharacterized membrane protein required for colicin V production